MYIIHDIIYVCIFVCIYIYRNIVDKLLHDNMYEVLHTNDQLVHCMKHKQVLEGFIGIYEYKYIYI